MTQETREQLQARWKRKRLANIRSSLLLHPVHRLLKDRLSDLLQQLLTHLHTTHKR